MIPNEDAAPITDLTRLRYVEMRLEVIEARCSDLELQRDALLRMAANARAMLRGEPWVVDAIDAALTYCDLTAAERALDAEQQSGLQAARDEANQSRGE